jgi:hypothetical protein
MPNKNLGQSIATIISDIKRQSCQTKRRRFFYWRQKYAICLHLETIMKLSIATFCRWPGPLLLLLLLLWWNIYRDKNKNSKLSVWMSEKNRIPFVNCQEEKKSFYVDVSSSSGMRKKWKTFGCCWLWKWATFSCFSWQNKKKDSFFSCIFNKSKTNLQSTILHM